MISVCIPTYCSPATLGKALACLQNQTHRDFEVIITDDSTDDATEKLIQTINFPADIPLLYFHNRQALGTPENWNESMKHARGEFILLHHHDDWLSTPDSLKKLVEPMLNNKETGFTFGNVEMYDLATGKFTHNNIPSNWQLGLLKDIPEWLTINNFMGPPTNILFRKQDNLWFDNKVKWLVDSDFYIRLIRSSLKFAYIPEFLIAVGTHKNQVTKSVLKDKALLLFEYFYEAEKFGIDLTKQPFLDGYGNWLMKLNVKSYQEIEKFNFQTDFSEAVEKMLKRKNLYRFRDYYVKTVMYWKYEVLKLKKKLPDTEL